MTIDFEELGLVKLAKQYSDEDKARELFESVRWPKGPECPRCQAKDPYTITPKSEKSSTRKGLYKCRKCRKPFTATVGTIFEGSHIPISIWLMTLQMMCAAKKGISAHQIHRLLGVSYKTAWFMCHRIRHAIAEGCLGDVLTGEVEVDEAYIGGKPRRSAKEINIPANQKATAELKKVTRADPNSPWSTKTPVVALVQRGGAVRVRVRANVSHRNIGAYLTQQIATDATVKTDCFAFYKNLFYDFKRHDMVNHSCHEYARKEKDGSVSHVNTAESFFSLIKRGIVGSFHHVSKEHLPRYCDEFAFRWNTRDITDGERLQIALTKAVGKRLQFRETCSPSDNQ